MSIEPNILVLRVEMWEKMSAKVEKERGKQHCTRVFEIKQKRKWFKPSKADKERGKQPCTRVFGIKQKRRWFKPSKVGKERGKQPCTRVFKIKQKIRWFKLGKRTHIFFYRTLISWISNY